MMLSLGSVLVAHKTHGTRTHCASPAPSPSLALGLEPPQRLLLAGYSVCTRGACASGEWPRF